MLFTNIDKKFAEIGFTKTNEDEYGVSYERYNTKSKFVQVIDIIHKTNGKHIIQSYDKYLSDCKGIGNTCVGLTYYELKLVLKKMKQLGYHK